MNTNNNFQYIFSRLCFSGLLLFLLTGCKKDWLNVKPTRNLAVPSKLSDYRAILNNTGVFNTNCLPHGEIASDGHYITEASWAANRDAAAFNAYTWSQETPYSASASYASFYNRIYQANLVQEGLRNVGASTETERREKDDLTGRALFIKAISYYWLSQIYAQPYRAATAATDQGILVQDNSDFLENVRRSSVEETYSLIIQALQQALPMLRTTPEHATHASKAAAHALLARTYLCMQRYDSAYHHANASLNIQNSLIDFSSYPYNSYFIGPFNPEVIYHDEMTNNESGSFTTSYCLIDPELYNSFSDNDLRKTMFMNVTSNNITFRGNYNNAMHLLFCGLATDEMYLTRAECYARRGDAASAMTDLNDLLRTRWKKDAGGATLYVNQTAADGNAALELILTERKKELMLRGLRWADLRRLNSTPATRITLTRTIAGKTYTLEPDSYRYTFPLPTNVLELSGEDQTSGWK